MFKYNLQQNNDTQHHQQLHQVCQYCLLVAGKTGIVLVDEDAAEHGDDVAHCVDAEYQQEKWR